MSGTGVGAFGIASAGSSSPGGQCGGHVRGSNLRSGRAALLDRRVHTPAHTFIRGLWYFTRVQETVKPHICFRSNHKHPPAFLFSAHCRLHSAALKLCHGDISHELKHPYPSHNSPQLYESLVGLAVNLVTVSILSSDGS